MPLDFHTLCMQPITTRANAVSSTTCFKEVGPFNPFTFFDSTRSPNSSSPRNAAKEAAKQFSSDQCEFSAPASRFGHLRCARSAAVTIHLKGMAMSSQILVGSDWAIFGWEGFPSQWLHEGNKLNTPQTTNGYTGYLLSCYVLGQEPFFKLGCPVTHLANEVCRWILRQSQQDLRLDGGRMGGLLLVHHELAYIA